MYTPSYFAHTVHDKKSTQDKQIYIITVTNLEQIHKPIGKLGETIGI